MTTAPFKLTGRHVLIGMVAFFSLVIGANATFITLAIWSFPGEEEAKAYAVGLNYNETLAERRAQAALGWREEIEIIRGPAAQAIIEMRDADGSPLDGLAIEGGLRRPAADGADIVLRFDALGRGRYRAPLPPDAAGQWELRATLWDAENRRFTLRSRLWL